MTYPHSRRRTTARTLIAIAIGVAIGIGCGSSGSGTHDSGAPGDAPAVRDAPAQTDANLTAPTDTPFVACTDTTAMVYAATAQAGAMPGTILACAPDPAMSMADVQTAVGSGVVATSAVKMYRVAYQTRDGAGGIAVTTSRAYLPTTARARPVPLVVTGHGSVGIADTCASSMSVDADLPLSYAARGFATIAPDGSGLGNVGTQDYLNNKQQGQQMLDGFRALRALLAPGVTSQTVILTGYSQGGGASLSAQSLFRSDGADLGTLAATVVYAPEWPIRLNSFEQEDILDNNSGSDYSIIFGYTFPVVMVLRQYAFWENHVGVGQGKTTVAAAQQGNLEAAIQSQCLVGFGNFVLDPLSGGGGLAKVDELMDPTLKSELVDCISTSGSGMLCNMDPHVIAYYNYLNANFLDSDPKAGPVLMMVGLADTVMVPTSEASCVHQKLVGEGTTVSSCVYLSAMHTDITHHKPDAIAWVEATLAGSAAPACENDPLPACLPN